MQYTIKELERRTKVSAHTLRYWAKCGLFPNIMRDNNDYRLFSDQDVLWVTTVRCLRETGMSIKRVLAYLKLCEVGDASLPERIGILNAQKAEILQTLQTYQEALLHLEKKIALMESRNTNNPEAEQNLREDFRKNLTEKSYKSLQDNAGNKKKIKATL